MKYLKKRAIVRPITGQFDRSRNYRRAVVIPALAEAEHLPLTIQSLCANLPESILVNTLVLVVVNNRPPESGTAANQADIGEQIAVADHRAPAEQLNVIIGSRQSVKLQANAGNFEVLPSFRPVKAHHEKVIAGIGLIVTFGFAAKGQPLTFQATRISLQVNLGAAAIGVHC